MLLIMLGAFVAAASSLALFAYAWTVQAVVRAPVREPERTFGRSGELRPIPAHLYEWFRGWRRLVDALTDPQGAAARRDKGLIAALLYGCTSRLDILSFK
jgi:hypothetical protein